MAITCKAQGHCTYNARTNSTTLYSIWHILLVWLLTNPLLFNLVLLLLISYATVLNCIKTVDKRFPIDYYMRILETQRNAASNKEPEIAQLSSEEPGRTMLHGTWFTRVARKTTRNEGHKIRKYGRMMQYLSQERGNKTRISRGNYNGLRIMKWKLVSVKVVIPDFKNYQTCKINADFFCGCCIIIFT